MTTTLRPVKGQKFWTVSEVLERLRDSFSVLEVDEPEGLLFVTERILRSRPHASHEELESLIEPLSDAVFVITADDRKSDLLFIRSFVVPGEPIWIDWDDSQHAARCQMLLVRYAAALDYEIVEA